MSYPVPQVIELHFIFTFVCECICIVGIGDHRGWNRVSVSLDLELLVVVNLLM